MQEKLSKSFGIRGVTPKQLNEFEQELKNALKQTSEITLIDTPMGMAI